MRLVVLRDFFFPCLVKFVFADAENLLDSPVERCAVGASQFLPNVRNRFVAIVLGDIEYE